MPYSFKYGIDDGYGTTQDREEVKDSYGNVKGSYGYMDANGIYRKVRHSITHFYKSLRFNCVTSQRARCELLTRAAILIDSPTSRPSQLIPSRARLNPSRASYNCAQSPCLPFITLSNLFVCRLSTFRARLSRAAEPHLTFRWPRALSRRARLSRAQIKNLKAIIRGLGKRGHRIASRASRETMSRYAASLLVIFIIVYPARASRVYSSRRDVMLETGD